MLDMVKFEVQIAVFLPPPGHTGFWEGIWLVSSLMFGKPRLQAAR